MSPRALAAVAVLTAAVVAPASGQGPGTPPAPVGYSRVGDAAPVPPGPPPATLDGHAYFPGYSGGSVVQIQDQVMTGEPSPGTAYPMLVGDEFSLGGAARGLQTWVGVEYLLFWTRHSPLPLPVANLGPAGSFGITGQSGVQTYLGNTEFSFHTFSGVKVNAGWWFTENQSVGIEGSLFVLPKKSTGTPVIVGHDILPTLARPFFDTALDRENSRILTRPDTFTGGIQVDVTQMVWGAEVLPVLRWIDNGGWFTLDAMTGFKFLSLEETLTINDFASVGRLGVANYNGQEYRAPAVTYVQDRFGTANRFYGAAMGLRANAHYEAFTASVTGKISFGTVHQQVRVDGTTSLAGPFPTVQVTPSGFYATGANSGTFEQNKFAVLPEIGVNLAVQLTSHLTLTLGYSGFYISETLRPGDQLSYRLNSTLIPTGQNYGARFGPQTPGIPFTSNAFWGNGFNFGFNFGY